VITLGDVAGIGPEVAVRAWRDPALHAVCRPTIIGSAAVLRRTLRWLGQPDSVVEVANPEQAAPSPDCITCLEGSEQDLGGVELGRVSAAAGQAAYDFLCRAIDLTRNGRTDGIVTLPLHKEGLRAAGLNYPGHTEILAARTGTSRYAMALLVRRMKDEGGRQQDESGPVQGASSFIVHPSSFLLAVTHVTLHMALRDVAARFAQLRPEAVLEKIELTDTMLRRLLERRPRIGVCGLNPHAGDGGLFGDEEARVIAPAIRAAREHGIDASGPWPADTLFIRAVAGEFDGIVAMYHDQGHIAVKLLAGSRAVNVTLGLPIVRTSVAHGTAYDIAGKGVADHVGLLEAARVAARLSVVRSP
jgi:4-hydroxythreonine-4-phosphate dehydrogenase